ncbi:hypothetical protein ACFY12_04195 [Streptomyces sp. NPDC001339]|uniref:hypothetical protein n=1 Tax=Streptomyces sp. NPDC001339 TaxID=3364563 RepID=UPI00368FFFA9
MADDRYNWLDKDAAEQLLRGEPVSARHGDGAHELEQLLEAAAATGTGPSGAAPLPGEEAAVAAFHRAAHRGAGVTARGRAADSPLTTLHTTGGAERPRFGRPFRRGIAVALAVCTIGGVAVAAGTGVLPAPFRGGGDAPEPGSSVSAAETPGTLGTYPPGAETGGTAAPTPGATHGGGTGAPAGTPAPGSPGATQGPGTGTPGDGKGRGGDHDDDRDGDKSGDKGKDGDGGPGHRDNDGKNPLLDLCRSYESGKRGEMARELLRHLESKAGGAEKVHGFCRAYLARHQNSGGSDDNDGVGGNGGGSGASGASGGSGGNGNSGGTHGSAGSGGSGSSGGGKKDGASARTLSAGHLAGTPAPASEPPTPPTPSTPPTAPVPPTPPVPSTPSAPLT